jgi:riboflavin synthase
MFTGIIQAVGKVSGRETHGGDARLRIAGGSLQLADVAIGDSIAVEGVCLTVVARKATSFEADVSRETLRLTTLGQLRAGAPVNLEKALSLGQPLGGHLMTGHVDGVGEVRSRKADARSTRFEIEAPAALARYIARKGSIAVNGVSLTVNEVRGNRFGVNLIPHTLAVTTLDGLRTGDRVNLEVDLLARYVERLAGGGKAKRKRKS